MYQILKSIYSLIRYPSFKRLKFFLIGVFAYKKNQFNVGYTKIIFPKSSIIQYGKYQLGLYENYEIDMVKKYVKSTDSVLELGGCVGGVSTNINYILKNKKNHVVLEPNKNLNKYLIQNKRLNKSEFSIENAVISKEKHVDFYVSKEYVSSSILHRYKKQKLEKKKVIGTSFKMIENKYKIKFNVVIMDIEGDEIKVLNQLIFSNLRLIILEFHHKILGEEGYNEMLNIFKINNFHLIDSAADVYCFKKK